MTYKTIKNNGSKAVSKCLNLKFTYWCLFNVSCCYSLSTLKAFGSNDWNTLYNLIFLLGSSWDYLLRVHESHIPFDPVSWCRIRRERKAMRIRRSDTCAHVLSFFQIDPTNMRSSPLCWWLCTSHTVLFCRISELLSRV